MSDSLGLGAIELEPPIPWRQVSDVETLRLIADPIRIAILRTLMHNVGDRLPVMSAKELAAALHEPQTKLYRHLKQLEEAGFIQVAEQRLVSRIVEQRYRAAQISIGMSPDLVIDPRTRNESLTMAVMALNDFRDELTANAAAERVRLDPADPHRAGVILQSAGARIPVERAAEFHRRLLEILSEFDRSGDPDGVLVRLLVAMYQIDETRP